MRNKLEISITKNWIFRKALDQKWYKAQVPGCIHTDLLNNKIIPDPFYGTNEEDLHWISDENWEYRTTIDINNEILRKNVQLLKFYGLDTYAKVYVNGKLLIESNNMFHPWEVSVKNIFQLGKNEILVSFESPVQKILPKMSKMDYELPADNDQIKKTSPHTRKAPYHYGWDWGPSFATCGIWQNVEVIAYDFFTINDVHIDQKEIHPLNAKIEINVDITSNVELKADLLIIEPKSKINISKSVNLKKVRIVFIGL
ncbi:MAG: sugar-binding domain-containing protein [bacterium]